MLDKLTKIAEAVYAALPRKVQDEITVAVTAAVAVVNVVQALAIPLPNPAHVAILVVTALAGVVGVRQNVTPQSKAK